MDEEILLMHASGGQKRPLISLLLLLSMALLGASCATDSRDQERTSLRTAGTAFKSQEYLLHSRYLPEKALLSLHVTEYRVNGEEIIVNPESRVAQELRGAITNFFNAILAQPTVRKGVEAQTTPVRATVRIDATEDTHMAGSALKAGVTGFFTLGLANAPAGKYDYECRMVMSVARSDGQSQVYEARERVNAEDRLEAGEPASVARREAAIAGFNAIVGQLSRDNFLASPEN